MSTPSQISKIDQLQQVGRSHRALCTIPLKLGLNQTQGLGDQSYLTAPWSKRKLELPLPGFKTLLTTFFMPEDWAAQLLPLLDGTGIPWKDIHMDITRSHGPPKADPTTHLTIMEPQPDVHDIIVLYVPSHDPDASRRLAVKAIHKDSMRKECFPLLRQGLERLRERRLALIDLEAYLVSNNHACSLTDETVKLDDLALYVIYNEKEHAYAVEDEVILTGGSFQQAKWDKLGHFFQQLPQLTPTRVRQELAKQRAQSKAEVLEPPWSPTSPSSNQSKQVVSPS